MRALSHQNDALRDELAFATTTDFSSKSKDGTVVHGLLARPAGAVDGQKLPTLLYIHGGPNGQDDYAFSFERELFAANGYAVLRSTTAAAAGAAQPSRRRSSPTGATRKSSISSAPWTKRCSWAVADPDRLGVGGWSYGGILTDYTIATDPRFKAAISGAGSALQRRCTESTSTSFSTTTRWDRPGDRRTCG